MNNVQRNLLKAIASRPPARRKDLSVTRLCIATGLSEKTIRNNLRKLRMLGFIEYSRPYTGKPYTFHVHDKAHEELEYYANLP